MSSAPRRGDPARAGDAFEGERWLLGELELVVSPLLLEEVERALAYPKVRARVEPMEASRLLALLDALGEHVPDPEGGNPAARSRDPDDDYLIALAASARATLVTGDSHLLDLEGSIPVVSPRAFLDSLD